LYQNFNEVSNGGYDPIIALVQPDNVGVNAKTNRGETALGNEFDIEAIYDYTEDVQIGANLGWYLPGALFDGVNQDIASQAIIHANVNF